MPIMHGRGRLAAFAALAAASGADQQHSVFDIDLSTLTHPPLWEPTLEEYFPVQRGGERDENGLASPVVLTSPSNEEFVHHARRGYPILVEDWGKGMQYAGWTGKNFADAFPFGYMKAEYITDMPNFKKKDHDVKIIDGEMRFNIGSFKPDKETMWHNLTRPASKRYSDDPQKPVTGPYVWHVKDELTPKQKQMVQGRFEAPSFLQDPLNSAKMNTSFELWFSPGDGCGAGAHNDGYCESVVSLQLRGDKKWRKMLEPEMTFLHSYDEFDGGVYDAGYWKPDLGFINRQGGAVVWPPGYLHETKTLRTDDGSCGAAITLQFSFPQPVQFLRAFLPRLSLSAEVGQCVGHSWSGYPTLYVAGIKPSPKGSDIEVQLQKILKALDTDGDEKITVPETLAFFKSPRAAKLDAKQFPKEHRELFYKFKAEDAVAYHDMDNDMVVSRQELWDSLVQWNVVRIRIQEGLKFVNKVDRKGLEAFETSLDFMRRAPIALPKKLRPELTDLFSLPKGTKVFPSLKGVSSFSDTEFFSRARDRVEQLKQRGRGRQEM
mmetsp:Transcript_168173/g.540256  ORF Transcript_168173/g.540256 Transcript_168173/m.540256 type:complete len:547 (+) Transcript_168173:45-1685(+)